MAQSDGVLEQVREIQKEFEAHKEEVRRSYEQRTAEWIAAHPGWEPVIERSIVPLDRVMGAIGFAFHPFQIQAPTEEAANVGDLGNAASTLNERLFREVAKEADALWERSLMGRANATMRTLKPIQGLRKKLSMLSFLDPRVGPVVDAIDDALEKLPKTGPLKGADFTQLVGLVAFLSDTDKMKAHGQRVLESNGNLEQIEAPEAPEAEPVPDVGEKAETPDPESEVVPLPSVAQAAEKRPEPRPEGWFY
jgi:hypothetical protein